MFLICFVLDDSGRYSRRVNDRHHQRRLKGGERILKAFELNPENTLEVISEEQLLYRVRSESWYTTKYNVSLQAYFCDCAARVSSCKHILGVQMIVNMYLLPYTHKDDGFEIFSPIEGTCVGTTSLDVANEENIEDALPMESKEEKLFSLLQELEVLMQESKLSIHKYKREEVLHKIEIGRKFLASFKEPFTFDRPQMVDLPSRVSIASLQANVQRTRMGYGKKKELLTTHERRLVRDHL